MKRNTIYILIIIVACFAVYGNIFNNEFVSDDNPSIRDNPNISRLFAAPTFANLTYHLDYKLYGLKPYGYHLTNIIFHALNSVLVFLFLLVFFGAYASFWGALVFGVHPIHTEAVAWISARNYETMTFFALLSILCYIRSQNVQKKGLFFYLAALVAYYFAIITSPFAYALLVLLILFDLTYGKGFRNWKSWVPIFILTGLRLLIMLSQLKGRVDLIAQDTGQRGLSNPVYNAVFSIFSHFGLVLWPLNLTLYHEPVVITRNLLIAEIVLLSAVIFLCLPILFKRKSPIFLAICFFILFLIPTFSPVTISWVLAERYIYLPSAAFSIFIAYFISKLIYNRKTAKKAARKEQARVPLWIHIILILLVAAYSTRTVLRNKDWATHTSIWRATVKASPLSPRAHNNMGDVHCLERNLPMAKLEFMRAIELRPDYADAFHNLASACLHLNQIGEAIENFKKAIRYNPRLYQSYQQLGMIYYSLGNPTLAKEYLNKAYEIHPDDSLLSAVR